MQIGIDGTSWGNKRGYGRHARALFGELIRLDAENQYLLFMDSNDFTELVPAETTIRAIHADRPAAIAASASGHRSLIDMWRMSRAMSSAELDVLIFPTIYSYVPVTSRAKKLVMIHDVIAETFPGLTLPTLSSRIFWKIKAAVGRRQADAIVTVSEYSRRKIVDYFKVSESRIHVVGESSDLVFHKIEDTELTQRISAFRPALGGRYIAYVGGFGPHKNLEMLISVFAQLALQRAFADIRLIMVGEYEREVFHSQYGLLQEQIRASGMAARVSFTGFLPDEELALLLNCATVLVLPSFMEGFGLPAVEAAACGCPVIATKESPLPELLGGGGLYIDPAKPDELCIALGQVLTSEELRRSMSIAGLEAAHKLTWEAAALQMKEVIEKVTA